MDQRHVKVTDLPPSVRAALEAVGYGRKDLGVSASETFDPTPPSGDGYRGFAAACRLDGTTAHTIAWGSWGGANPWNRSVDDGIAGGSAEIPPGVAFLRGCVGGGKPVYASLTVRPGDLEPLLGPGPSVTAREALILAIFKSLKSGARPEYLSRARVLPREVDSLVSRGFLARNRAGATSVTTEGRNAAGRDYDVYDRADPRLVPVTEPGEVAPADPVSWR